ncbi:phasin family protein [Bradyrhizobium sp. SRL28]|nr:phasin family protein [Bradyrhizobium sp. SRL28]MBT1511803.1 phasin family protein [Bradyrhizobium sp. SRL28]
MSTTDENKPAGKSGRRKGKGERRKKAVSQESLPASPAPAQLQSPDQDRELQQPEPVHAESPKVDQQPAVEEPVAAVVASPEPQPVAALSPSEPSPAEKLSIEPAAAELAPVSLQTVEEPVIAAASPQLTTAPSEPPPAEPASAAPASAEPAPVSLQTIANAYRDYTRKSIEEFGSFVEQLSGVRSLDKAMTVQSEFVKRAYETSVAESQKICELHNRLAKQTLDPFKGLTGKAPTTHGKP